MYTVFISHSTRDRGLVITLANLLTKFKVTVLVAEWYLSPGESLDKKIFTQIDEADCVVVLLTRHGIRSRWVHEEIGYALKGGNPIIPVVEKGTSPQDLAALQGKEYIEYDSSQPQEALIKTASYVKSLELKKSDQEKALLVIGGIIAFTLSYQEGNHENPVHTIQR